MNFMESAYQALARTVRKANIQGGYGWPGKPIDAQAVSRYPNILAEISAYNGWLYLAADHAGVSWEIMAAVVEDGEDLTAGELGRLAAFYRCGAGLLSAPALQLVDPATNKGKTRRRRLADLVRAAEGFRGGFLTERELAMCRARLRTLERGGPITYAMWRNACQTIQDAERWQQRPRARSARLTPGPAPKSERRPAS